MRTCAATKPGKYGVVFRCERAADHDGPHTEGLPNPIAGQVGFTYSWADAPSTQQ